MGTRKEASEAPQSRDGRYIECFLKDALVEMSLKGEVGVSLMKIQGRGKTQIGASGHKRTQRTGLYGRCVVWWGFGGNWT